MLTMKGRLVRVIFPSSLVLSFMCENAPVDRQSYDSPILCNGLATVKKSTRTSSYWYFELLGTN